MSGLSNQECRDLKGSLSDRGCYFDKDGKATENRQKAVSFSCLDCGKTYAMIHEFIVMDKIKGKKVVRPVCACCNLYREDLADACG